MKIEIRNRFDNKIILSGKYASIKECLEKNRGTDLRSANLGGADLRSANLWGADLRSANLEGADLEGADLEGANLWGADLGSANLGGADLEGTDLRSANLGGADLEGADLRGANLWGADLGSANLGSAKNYLNSHYFFQEIVKRQKIDTFTQKEWSIIGQIIIHKLCWDSIRKRFNKSAIKIFKKLSKVGFNAWEAKYEES